MSIYPVKISKWYVAGKPFGKELPMLESMLNSGHFNCAKCNKQVGMSEGWVLHSITFGGPDERWCSDECIGYEAVE